MWKKPLFRFLVRTQLPRLLRDPLPFNQLLGRAVLMQSARLGDEQFRQELDAFYSRLDPAACKRDIAFGEKSRKLNRPGGYKTDILGLEGDSSSADPGRFDLWGRRFRLLRQLGIRSDLLIVRAGEQIPPHAHSQVVSGFYVLEGEVAIRHYDRVEESAGHVLLRKAIDTTLAPGGYTTNSEYHHNIHWLLGVARVSFLFRFTATGVPVRRFGSSRSGESRIYVDPTVAPEPSGLIRAPYIGDAAAKKVRFLLTTLSGR